VLLLLVLLILLLVVMMLLSVVTTGYVFEFRDTPLPIVVEALLLARWTWLPFLPCDWTILLGLNLSCDGT